MTTDPQGLSTGVFRCLIGKRWCGSPDDAVINPATGAVLAKVPHFGAVETQLAIDAAGSALADWSSRTAMERGQVLEAWFALIGRHREDLARLLTAEQGSLFPRRAPRSTMQPAS